jgi:hypothetical protein
MVSKQAELVTERTVQIHLPVCPAAGFDSALQLVLTIGSNCYGEGRSEQWRMTRRLQVGEKITRILRPIEAPVGHALIADCFCPCYLVRILHLASH